MYQVVWMIVSSCLDTGNLHYYCAEHIVKFVAKTLTFVMVVNEHLVWTVAALFIFYFWRIRKLIEMSLMK